MLTESFSPGKQALRAGCFVTALSPGVRVGRHLCTGDELRVTDADCEYPDAPLLVRPPRLVHGHTLVIFSIGEHQQDLCSICRGSGEEIRALGDRSSDRGSSAWHAADTQRIEFLTER